MFDSKPRPTKNNPIEETSGLGGTMRSNENFSNLSSDPSIY